MTPSSDGETSLLLWFMAAVVALLAAYLFVGWLRRAHGRQGWREVLGPVVLSATVMGLGMSAAMVLAMSAGGLTFPLGYRWVAIPALVFGPVIACLPAAWWLSRRQNWLALIGCGLLLAAVALAVQTGWIMAAGLRPGIRKSCWAPPRCWKPPASWLRFGWPSTTPAAMARPSRCGAWVRRR